MTWSPTRGRPATSRPIDLRSPVDSRRPPSPGGSRFLEGRPTPAVKRKNRAGKHLFLRYYGQSGPLPLIGGGDRRKAESLGASADQSADQFRGDIRVLPA